MEDTSLAADTAQIVEARSAWFIPIAIVAAGIILALSVYVVRSTAVLGVPEGDVSALREVSDEDHIIGNPAAPVVIIEYADIDSSYAKSFQATMEQLMTEYAPGGQVAWVYRHFPLIDQHRNSMTHAEAAECAASLGGPDSFWRFISLVQTLAPGNQQFSPSRYETVIAGLGIDQARFTECMAAHPFRNRVSNDISNAIAIGAEGSPYTVIIIRGEKVIPIDGALPYDAMKKVIQEAIAKAQ